MWMCRPESPTPELSLMQVVAECYRNSARATRLVVQIRGKYSPASQEYTAALNLLAESLSALRAAITDIDEYVDPDQNAMFLWLRSETFSSSVFVERHMRLDDPANPQDWLDLQTRLNQLESRIEQTAKAERDRVAGLNKAKYHVGKLGRVAADELAGHWQKIIDAATQLVQGGMKPSNVELRDILLPCVDQLPENEIQSSAEFDLVLREIDRYLASRETEDPQPAVPPPSPDVLVVRPALVGKALVLIGGQERRASANALSEAFGLSRIDWQSSKPHESHYNFEAAISRADVVVVLLAIRFSSHSFSEVSSFCDTHRKPLVRLPGGYSPNQVAAMIRRQAGKQLGVE
jgi:hypothetical protein